MTIRQTTPRRTAVAIVGFALLLTFAGALSARANHLLYMVGQSKPVECQSIRYKASSDEYVVVTKAGAQTMLPASRVARVQVPKPPGFDAAASDVANGSFDRAISTLDRVVQDYRKLQWDVPAYDLLARAYMGKGAPDRAASVLEKLFETIPVDQAGMAVRRRYWEALRQANRQAKLKGDLTEVIAKGSRPMAAAAYMVRGDMYFGDSQFTDALIYGYLRTALLFKDVKELQPEAMYRTALCLDKIRDPRAERFRKELVRDYPGSSFAQDVRAGR